MPTPANFRSVAYKCELELPTCGQFGKAEVFGIIHEVWTDSTEKEADIRPIARTLDWRKQRRQWAA